MSFFKKCCLRLLKLPGRGEILFSRAASLTLRLKNSLPSPFQCSCQFCVDTHSQRTIAAGATKEKEEVAEAFSVAMYVAAGSQIGLKNISGENIYDKIVEKDKGEEDGGCCGESRDFSYVFIFESFSTPDLTRLILTLCFASAI